MSTLKKISEREEKLQDLKKILGSYDSAITALSGGVDSSFLLAACAEFMEKEQLLAVTSVSEIHPRDEIEAAQRIADRLDVRWRKISTNILEEEKFLSNPRNRCYFCKLNLFEELKKLAREEGLDVVLEGGTLEDRKKHRPGEKAIEELGIKSPLKESGLGKEKIRKLAEEIGLPNWDRPSRACLATRFPYGERIKPPKLDKLERVEAKIRDMGLKGFRVRNHDRINIARIEVQEDQLEKIIKNRKKITELLRGVGYTYVTLDLDGYRPAGSHLKKDGDG